MSLKILQINIRGIKCNLLSLNSFLSNNNIDVAFISEMKLKQGEKIHLRNYNAFYKYNDQNDGSRGLLTLSKKNLITKHQSFTNVLPIEALETEIVNLSAKIKVLSIYIPAEADIALVKRVYGDFVSKYDGLDNVLIVGDYNAHHPLWNRSGKTDRRGVIMADIITNSNLVILNDGSHTYEIIQNDILYKSALDVTLVSRNLALKADWTRVDEFLGSDHLPIITCLFSSNINNNTTIVSKTDHVKACKLISELDTEYTADIEDFTGKIRECIDDATKNILYRGNRTSKPLWNENIQQLWTYKNNKQKIHNKFKNVYTMLQLKKATAKLKREIKLSKKSSWNSFVESITPSMNSKEIWRRIKCVNGRN